MRDRRHFLVIVGTEDGYMFVVRGKHGQNFYTFDRNMATRFLGCEAESFAPKVRRSERARTYPGKVKVIPVRS